MGNLTGNIPTFGHNEENTRIHIRFRASDGSEFNFTGYTESISKENGEFFITVRE